MPQISHVKEVKTETTAASYYEGDARAVVISVHLPEWGQTVTFQAHVDEEDPSALVCIYCPKIVDGKETAEKYLGLGFDCQDC